MIDQRRVRLLSCVGVDYEPELIPHFLEHYLAMGVPAENIHMILHSKEAGSAELAAARAVLAAHGVDPAELWTGAYTSGGMWDRRRSLQDKVAGPEDWVVSADVDELHEYPCELRRFLADCERRGVNAVQGVFVDRLAAGGELKAVSHDEPLDRQFPIQADVICSIGGIGRHHGVSGTVKMMAFVPALKPSIGGHRILDGDIAPRYFCGRNLGQMDAVARPWLRALVPLRVHHYKWTASMLESVRTRLDTPGASRGGSEYGRKIVDYAVTHGRIRLSDVVVYSERQLATGRRVPAWRAALTAADWKRYARVAKQRLTS